MAVTKATVKAAGQEIGDLVSLLLDDVSNKEQIVQFATEGFQAVQALAAIGIPTEHKQAVATNLVEAILARLDEKVFVLPD
jgi:hypothetical protein